MAHTSEKQPEDPEVREAPDVMPPLLVSPKQACRLLNLGMTSLYELLDAGELKSVRVGRRRLINYASCQALAENGTGAVQQTGARAA